LRREAFWDSGLNKEQFETPPSRATASAAHPQVLAACLLRVGDRILLSRRAIPPRIGCWTIPGGYVEAGETPEQGARRELEEEARVSVPRAQLLGVYEMPQIFQVLFLYAAQVESCAAQAGPESSAVCMCHPGEAPWNDLAFATDRRTVLRLRHEPHCASVEYGRFHWGTDGAIRLSVADEQPSVPRNSPT
jgi:ADP-ribose pyrophosphatase YjhB (NUDIX family)